MPVGNVLTATLHYMIFLHPQNHHKSCEDNNKQYIDIERCCFNWQFSEGFSLLSPLLQS